MDISGPGGEASPHGTRLSLPIGSDGKDTSMFWNKLYGPRTLFISTPDRYECEALRSRIVPDCSSPERTRMSPPRANTSPAPRRAGAPHRRIARGIVEHMDDAQLASPW